MTKEKSVFVCSVCGAKSHKWQGKCFECNSFNSFIAETMTGSSTGISHKLGSIKTIALNDISIDSTKRYTSGMKSIDSLLAGGYVAGQTVLLGGEPGIGKSTLLLQLSEYNRTFYIAGEESSDQIKVRAERLGIRGLDIEIIDEQDVDMLVAYLRDQSEKSTTPTVVIVDSIQSLFSSHIKSISGSISQVQYCATLLNEIAKKYRYIMVFVGQVTKSGYLAGPKLLEHLVDTVIYFYGDRRAELRALRVEKNRFGPAQGLEMFVMEEEGLQSADAYFEDLIATRKESVTGTVLSVALEGSHPIVLEVQALSVKSKFSNPRRIVNGYSTKRVEMLLAVIGKRLKVNVSLYDFYLNISGGIKVDDYSLDLPIVLAVLSVVKDKPIDSRVVAFGEVGLLGEIKPVSRLSLRKDEAGKRGFESTMSSEDGKTVFEIASKLRLLTRNPQ